MSIKQLTVQIISDNNFNKLNELLQLAMNDHLETSQEAIIALKKIFMYLLQNKFFTMTESNDQVEKFLSLKWNVYMQILFQKIQQNTLPQLISSLQFSNANIVLLQNSQYFLQLVETMINSKSEQLQAQFSKQYLSSYVDLGAAFFSTAQKLKNISYNECFNFLKIIDFVDLESSEMLYIYEEQANKKTKISSECYKPIKEQENLSIDQVIMLRSQNYTNFITNLISQIKDKKDIVLEFFRIVNKYVVDKVENPLIISNFIQHHFDHNSDLEVKILALQSLFILIGKFQFNYESFYTKLENLISEPNIFEFPETPRFLKLLYLASKSSKIPQEQLLQIIKKVLQRALLLRPHRQFWVVSFLFNVIKKNQTLKKYLQRLDEEQTNDQNYLWELISFQDHWIPEIKDIVKMLGEDLNEYDYLDLEPIADLDEEKLLSIQFLKFKQKNTILVEKIV